MVPYHNCSLSSINGSLPVSRLCGLLTLPESGCVTPVFLSYAIKLLLIFLQSVINNSVTRATSEARNCLRNRASDPVLQPRDVDDAIIKSTALIDRDRDAAGRRRVGERDRCGKEREGGKNECRREVHISQGFEGFGRLLSRAPKGLQVETLRHIRGVIEALYS